MAYIVFLKTQLKSPGAILNYLSTARTWYLALFGEAKQYDTYRVSVLKKGLARVMQHKTLQAPAVEPAHLRHMVAVLNELGRVTLPVKALLLVAYFSALRQSNLLGCHVLLARDVVASSSELRIVVRSTKTLCEPKHQVCIVLPAIHGSACCPVRAWKKYYKRVTPLPEAPAFGLPFGHKLTVAAVTALLRQALVGSSYVDPQRFTLHALRRGAVHACAKAGVSRIHMKELGQWKSNAIDAYLPQKTIEAATSTLTAYFGEC